MNYAIETGLRGLRRHPRTMVLSILTLGLGLASVMTMLSLLAMLSADPLPGLSQQLYLGWVDSRESPKPNDPADDDASNPPALWKLEDVRAIAAGWPGVRQAAVVATMLNMDSEDGSSRKSGFSLLSTGPMLSMFGVPLLHGRAWTMKEAQDHAKVVVLSSKFSLELLGTEDGVGRNVRIGTQLFRVIGISGQWTPRPMFYFMQQGVSPWIDAQMHAFVPAEAALEAGVAPMSVQTCDENPDGDSSFDFTRLDVQRCRFLQLWAELRTPQQVSDFHAALQSYAQDRHEAGVFQRSPQARLYGVAGWLDANHVVPDSVRLNLWLAGSLLALCLVNVAGLLAARFLQRSGELGVRRVLGAPRRAIFVTCLVESGLAGVLGGLLAWPLTLGGLWLVRQQAEAYAAMARFNPLLFGLLALLAIATGLLVGLLPAWRATRLEPALQVKTL